MATAGPNAPGTTASTDRGALNPIWNAPSNAVSSNNAYATSTVNTVATQTPSDYLDLTNFGFSVPSGATVNGITVAIERKGTTSVQDDTVQLIKGGTASGTNKADTGTNWPASDASVSYGGVSDLWSLTLADTDVNASNFGVRVAIKTATGGAGATGSVDVVTISIDYTAAAGGSVRMLGTLGVGT